MSELISLRMACRSQVSKRFNFNGVSRQGFDLFVYYSLLAARTTVLNQKPK
jgi:hypothetical protein